MAPDALAVAVGQIEEWDADHAAVVVSDPTTDLARHGDVDERLPTASVTKPVVALAVLVAVEEEAIDLDEPCGPPGATVRHLLAHASGLAFDDNTVRAQPGERRIYSNTGFERLGRLVAERTGLAFATYVHEAVLDPLGMHDSALEGSPAKDLRSTATDLGAFARELLRPTLIAPETLAMATSVVFPGLAGVLPGVGAFDPLDWGLGFELKGRKTPHWSGEKTAPATFGHFGATGTFVWVDPTRELACVVLTDRDFGSWAMRAWPSLSDAVIEAATSSRATSSSGGFGPTG